MIPTLAERVAMVATEMKAAVLRTKEVPVAKFGLSSNASAARNAKALNAAIAGVDPGTVIRFGSRTYAIDQGVVRGTRGNIELRGDGYQRTVLEYTSEAADGSVGAGTCITFGVPDPSTVPHGSTGSAPNVTVRGLGFRDRSSVMLPVYEAKHWPAALEMFFIENALVDACGFQNVKGNSGLNLLGISKSQFEGLTQLATVQNCWFGGDASGGATQGDGVNAGGYATIVLRGNRTQGGLGRHFMELGTGIVDLIVEDNVGDLKGQGMTHLGSWTASRSAQIRRNTFSNWGNGASSISVLPDAPQYNMTDGSSIFTAADGTPLLLNKVVGVLVEENTFNGGPACWPAAIGIIGGDLRNHVYRNNHFNCPLAFYVVEQPNGFEISGNDFTPDADGRAFIALAAQLETPTSPAAITGNTLRKSAKLFDRGSWATDARVSGVAANVIG